MGNWSPLESRKAQLSKERLRVSIPAHLFPKVQLRRSRRRSADRLDIASRAGLVHLSAFASQKH